MSVIIGPLNHSFCGIIGQWNVVNKSFELEGRNPVPDCCRLTEKLSSNTNTYKRVSRSVGQLVGWSVGRLVGWSVYRSDLAFLASNFNILAVYGPIRLCFTYYAHVGLCYHISRAHGPITTFGVHRGI